MRPRWPVIFDGRLLFRSGPSYVRFGAAFVWLGFIFFPLADAIGQKGPALGRVLAIAGALIFVAAYIRLVLLWRGNPSRVSTWQTLVLFGVLVSIATALTVADRSSWGFLFTYCAACAALVVPAEAGVAGVGLCVALAGGASAIDGASGGTVVSFIATSAGIGLLMLLMRDLRVRNAELSEARAEMARLAVAEERERFAPDLHDLLGHTLSVIALKAELAGRLLPGRPQEAATEVAEVESVARTALGEVRDPSVATAGRRSTASSPARAWRWPPLESTRRWSDPWWRWHRTPRRSSRGPCGKERRT